MSLINQVNPINSEVENRKAILNMALLNITEQKITLPKEAWIIFKEFINTGKSQLATLDIKVKTINRKLTIKLCDNPKKKSKICLNNELTESVRRTIINDALVNAYGMNIDVSSEVMDIFNKYIETGEEQTTEISIPKQKNDKSKFDRSLVIRLYNTIEKKSYVCVRKNQT